MTRLVVNHLAMLEEQRIRVVGFVFHNKTQAPMAKETKPVQVTRTRPLTGGVTWDAPATPVGEATWFLLFRA